MERNGPGVGRSSVTADLVMELLPLDVDANGRHL
jgi:hypothetical protein